MAKPVELIESILAGEYDPGPGRVVEMTCADIAARVRVRAKTIAPFAGAEAAELDEVAHKLDGAGPGTVRISAIDAAALMGSRAAVLAR